tara:strand:+ start:347 stop:643 length:297 start_codon:yes stop_codon:yes gene_type:complete
MTVGEVALDEAKALITGERQDTYGSAQSSFETIGALWSIYLRNRSLSLSKEGADLSAYDVAYMMSIMKAARLMNGYDKDSNRDMIGYAALAAEMAEIE